MSFVLHMIRTKTFSNLKAVKIYITHSFKFDVNYNVDKALYSMDAPDLMIISPAIIVVDEGVKVDLSCKTIPGYPNGETKVKLNPNIAYGLQGFNGGNLFIFAEKVIPDVDVINFVSEGGEGGPAQKGKYRIH